MEPSDIVKFLRRRDFVYEKELGQGACGQTVLLRDDLIDEVFVCKKFVPYAESERKALYENFVRETKLLHMMAHRNVVRVFNYYLYPDELTGYILMEYVDGQTIDAHVQSRPDSLNDLFVQAIDAFAYLESINVLHRDLRTANLMVRSDGELKVIDFGFGKSVSTISDFDKSVSLNLWCEPPAEFAIGAYDYCTEVYFVGKLFQDLIAANALEDFKYPALLGSMARHEPGDRISSFADVRTRLNAEPLEDAGFNHTKKQVYRRFADELANHVTKIERSATYYSDVAYIGSRLEQAYRDFMLEEEVPDCAVVTRCFIKGEYFYNKTQFPVEVVREFLKLLKSSSPEKRQVLVANLQNRLNATKRYAKSVPLLPVDEDDIPF